MSSLRKHEGYLLNDNRANGGGMQENPTITCSHCQRVVILNPGRTRDREYCSGCDHYICDGCAKIRATAPACRPLKALLDKAQEEAFRQEQAERGSILISI